MTKMSLFKGDFTTPGFLNQKKSETLFCFKLRLDLLTQLICPGGASAPFIVKSCGELPGLRR